MSNLIESEKMYKLICSSRFNSIDKALVTHGKIINDMNKKVNNGFELKIDNLKEDIKQIKKEIKSNRKLLWTLLISILGGMFALIASYIAVHGI